MFRKLRIAILLFVLASLGVGAWKVDAHMSSWERTVHVALYPIAGDDSPVTQAYVQALEVEAFAEIESWLQAQVQNYGVTLADPLDIWLAPVVSRLPPAPVRQPSALQAIWWSLQLRWWAFRHDEFKGVTPQVRLFVIFHDPARTAMVPHSTGLEKGRIAIVHAFASRRQQHQNALVIAHELLHTYGASDKYDPQSLQPDYPQGYADPEQTPLLPQYRAEIMGGRIPVSEIRADIPAGLQETIIGPLTAAEIGLTLQR